MAPPTTPHRDEGGKLKNASHHDNDEEVVVRGIDEEEDGGGAKEEREEREERGEGVGGTGEGGEGGEGGDEYFCRPGPSMINARRNATAEESTSLIAVISSAETDPPTRLRGSISTVQACRKVERQRPNKTGERRLTTIAGIGAERD